MTTNRLMQLATCTAAALLLAACASTPLDEQAAAPVTDKSASATAAKPTEATPDTRAVARVDTTPKAIDPLEVVEVHGKYLVANPTRRVVIEGNADERGSREYNLALGQKRAEAVKSRLRLLGVQESQIETVSLGEEKPVATGSDEASWAQNRRADLNYR